MWKGNNNRYPWFARTEVGGRSCGGQLVSPEFVLTTAHCFFDENHERLNGNVTVTVGMLCDDDNAEREEEQQEQEGENCGQVSLDFVSTKSYNFRLLPAPVSTIRTYLTMV